MSDNPTTPAPALGHLEQISQAELRRWLDQALRGLEPLPRFTADEAPEITIARHEVDLGSMVRSDLRRVTMQLLVELVRGVDTGVHDDDYARSLLGMARRLDVKDAAVVLGELARGQSFESMPQAQQAAVLGTLIDLRAPLGRELWQRVAQSGRHQALAFSGLLRAGIDAVEVLPRIPGDERVADALYVVLSQYARDLDPVDRHRLEHRMRAVAERCVGAVRTMVDEWLAEQDGDTLEAEQAEAPLDQGLGAFFAKRNARYQRTPSCARLLPALTAVCT